MEPQLVRDALNAIRKRGVVSVELLSRDLGLPLPISKLVLESLVRSGYLEAYTCGGKCSGCSLAGLCSFSRQGGRPIRLYRLVKR